MNLNNGMVAARVSSSLQDKPKGAAANDIGAEEKQESNYFPPTTAEQRRLLFETWQQTGNIRKSCQKAGVSRTTFYHWRDRFMEHGFAALESPRSNAPHRPRRVAANIVEKVIEIRTAHPTWGKLRISKAVNSQLGPKSVSPNSVMRILIREELW